MDFISSEFALAEVAPHVEEWDVQHRFPVELVPKMGDLGLFGLVVPEEFGGAGADFTSLCVAIEELGRVDQSVGRSSFEPSDGEAGPESAPRPPPACAARQTARVMIA